MASCPALQRNCLRAPLAVIDLTSGTPNSSDIVYMSHLAGMVKEELPGVSVRIEELSAEFTAHGGRAGKRRVSVTSPQEDGRVLIRVSLMPLKSRHVMCPERRLRVKADEMDTVVAIVAASLRKAAPKPFTADPARLLRIPYPCLKRMTEEVAFSTETGRMRGVLEGCTGSHGLGARLTARGLELHALGPCCLPPEGQKPLLIGEEVDPAIASIVYAYTEKIQ